MFRLIRSQVVLLVACALLIASYLRASIASADEQVLSLAKTINPDTIVDTKAESNCGLGVFIMHYLFNELLFLCFLHI